MPTPTAESGNSRVARLWQSSGFAAVFTLFLGAVVLSFYFDDQSSIATLNAQLSVQREQRDREIISTNHDITVLQEELRHVQSALLANQRALTSTQDRLAAVLAAYQHHAPVPAPPADYQPAVKMTPAERAEFTQNLEVIKAIEATTRSNEDAFRAAARSLLEIRHAIAAARPAQEAKGLADPWSRAHIEEADAALQSQLAVLDDRRKSETKEGPYLPQDLSMAMFVVGLKNAELTEVQHQLLSVQADLGAAQQELARLRKVPEAGR